MRKTKGIYWKYISNVLAAVFLCAACQNMPNEEHLTVKNENAKLEDRQEIVKAVDVSPAKAGYQFYDKAVKAEVEEYFEKKADKLTDEDFKKLSGFSCFTVSEPIQTLEDIPTLFPELKYLDVNFENELTEANYYILSNLNTLKALTLEAVELPMHLDFIEKMNYFELSCQAESDLASYSALGEFFIKEKVKKKIRKFVCVKEAGRVFELVSYENTPPQYSYVNMKRMVFVSEKNKGTVECKSILKCINETRGFMSNRLFLVDVDFDGKKDVLVDDGHFGAQGLVEFSCFIYKNGNYRRCNSFSKIANPSVDSENKKILSTWRNSGASHSWAMYSYHKGKYTMTNCLTIELDENSIDKKKEIWNYQTEKLVNGKMRKDKVYSEKDYTTKQLNKLFYSKKSFWAINSDKWETIFNGGNMADFSIYSDSSVNTTILNAIQK